MFRHYWILVKFLLTVGATTVLLLRADDFFGFLRTVSRMSGVAAETTLSSADFGALRIQLLVHAGGGLLVLLTTTTLSVYKPWSRTRYGRRKLSQPIPPRRLTTTRNKGGTDMGDLPSPPDSNDDISASTTGRPWWLYVLLGIIGLVVLFVVLHLTGGGRGGH